MEIDLTHSSSSAPSPSALGFCALPASALLAIILSVHDAPTFPSPAKLHLVTVPPSTLAKETESTTWSLFIWNLWGTDVTKCFTQRKDIQKTNKKKTKYRHNRTHEEDAMRCSQAVSKEEATTTKPQFPLFIAWSKIQLKVISGNLNWILNLMGSQWKKKTRSVSNETF